jgi:hypothetical protein
MIDTSPKIKEGSYREILDETHIYIQSYQFGVWNSIIKLPLNEPAIIGRVRSVIARIEEGIPPQQPWPFPTQPEPTDQPADDSKQSYIDYVKDVIKGKEDEQRFKDYERAKKVVDENR